MIKLQHFNYNSGFHISASPREDFSKWFLDGDLILTNSKRNDFASNKFL
jgi:hypothetical protein